VSKLPRGTVTLLFTDIEGSTRLLQRVGERYADMLEACRQLLRTAFHEYHGHEIDTQGDSFFVAFARATDAVSASVAAQRALAAQIWPEGVAVCVRMGLHTGEPQLATENYVGLDVHRAARIMSAGHGGQVLLSQTTRDLVEQALPDGVGLLDLGEHRLKDLRASIRLFQLVIAGLPTDFPPLKTLDSHPNNLPIQPTWLVGREREARAIEDLLLRSEVRLVTLTGAGGVGKTRLALQVAADLSGAFTDGVYFVNLAPVRDPALVLPAITQAFALSEIREYSLLDVLHNALHDRQLLLLLDNFEQVVEAADLLADLLAHCAGLKLLVTSRMALHLRAEHEFAVLPLALPDPRHLADMHALSQFEAVVLFVARAQAVRPAFEVTTANAPAIAEICTRLDGLPLAIELAAARLNVLPLQALLARLSQRLRLLTGGARDAPARQQTLRNTLAWSYELLTTAEQHLFRHLAAFVGGCTLEAVESLVRVLDDAPADVLDTLASLVDKSLLRQASDEGEEPRFVMLETICEYGLEMLAAQGELERTRQAHAAYFLELAEQAELGLEGPEQIRWLKRLEMEHANLRASLEWLLGQGGAEQAGELALRLGSALAYFWRIRGHYSVGRSMLSQALATRAKVGASLRARALHAVAGLAHSQGDYAQAEALNQESLALARELGDTRCIVEALQGLGGTLWFRDLGLARAVTEEALALARALGDPWNIAGSVYTLGNLLFLQEDHNAARSLLEESLTRFREVGDPWCIANSLQALALSHVPRWSGMTSREISERNLARARTLLEEALALQKNIGDKQSAATSLLWLGEVVLEQGEMTSAQSLAEEALRSFKELGDMQGVADTLLDLGELAITQGNYTSARARYVEGLALARERIIQHPVNTMIGLEGLAEVVAAQGEPIWAARLWGAALAQREATSFPLTPYNPARYERAVAAVRAQIGEQVFAVAWAEGRAMSLEQVLVAPAPHTIPPTSPTGQSSRSPAKSSSTFPDNLTAREVEVLRLVAQGLTDFQVAEQLVISPRTVNSHLTAIYGKIQVSSRSAATRYAIEHHLI
jgi:predicted ATPase/class 3 adenylate cyclase/DNA-binding CsgD family transcriptional regulator